MITIPVHFVSAGYDGTNAAIRDAPVTCHAAKENPLSRSKWVVRVDIDLPRDGDGYWAHGNETLDSDGQWAAFESAARQLGRFDSEAQAQAAADALLTAWADRLSGSSLFAHYHAIEKWEY